jgi:NADPH:quinone reductase-like Zn-dependent oxidoreductase
MKAIVQPTYGSPDDLQLRDIDQPTIGDHDVLVRVHAASVNTADRLILRGRPYLMRAAGSGHGFSPRRPQFAVAGTDLAGRVAAVGSLVTAFRPGDEVYGSVPGAIAEYVAAPDTALAAKPSSLSFQQAAAMPLAALTALQGLRDAGQVQPGQRVLINGASGGVGTYAVQIAKVLGAEVTAVTSGPNVEMVRSLGADHVIDYTSEDFTESASRYDVILDLVGNHSLSARRRALTATGTLLLSYVGTNRWVGPFGHILAAVVLTRFTSHRIVSFTTAPSSADLLVLAQLTDDGKIVPVIDRTYRLDQAAEAIRYLELGRARGKVIISISDRGALAALTRASVAS